MKVSEVKSTEELIELIKVCGWLFAVVVVMLVFGLTVFAMLYSVIFVTQPIKSMAPIDQAFTKL
jgi:flagellar biosynthesis protein FlhB